MRDENPFVHPSAIVQFQKIEHVAPAGQAERIKQVLERDFDEFNKIRAYVIKHRHELKGAIIPWRIESVQFLPGHECLYLDDIRFVSFTEAKEYIDYVLQRKKNGSHCPYCGTATDPTPVNQVSGTVNK